MKICSICNKEKSLSDFYSGNGKDGKHYWCKDCFKAANKNNYEKKKDEILTRQAVRRKSKDKEIKECIKKWKQNNKDKVSFYFAKRRANKLNAAVKWANNFFISEIYKLAQLRTKLTGIQWHVDHIIPLINKNVCGLHCEQNLQIIPAIENLKKGNKHEI